MKLCLLSALARLRNSLKLNVDPCRVAVTKNLRELHLVLVNTIILPRLEELLSVTEPILVTTECQPKQGPKKIPTAQCFDIIEKEFLLRRFAVKMLGMVFRSRTGEGEKRGHFIELLQKVATSTPYGMREWVRQRELDDEQASSGDVGTLSASEFLKGEELNLRFEGELLHNVVVAVIHDLV